MARLCPSLPPRLALTLGDRAELDLLETLDFEAAADLIPQIRAV